MNFHEYQAKELFASYGIPVPAGTIARTPDEAVIAAQGLGGHMWVVKAQVHAGGRGKAGGVKLVRSLDELRSEANRMLSMRVTTYQTGGLALPVVAGRQKILLARVLVVDRGRRLQQANSPSQVRAVAPDSLVDQRIPSGQFVAG